jgi:hypothetical protein
MSSTGIEYLKKGYPVYFDVYKFFKCCLQLSAPKDCLHSNAGIAVRIDEGILLLGSLRKHVSQI